MVTSTTAGSSDIYAVSPSGKGAPRLIVGGPGRQQQPAVSPDGRTVAFKTVTTDPRDEETWLVGFDGNGARPLTATPGELRFSTQPAWWPDGQRLLVRSNRGGPQDVWSIRASDGGDPVRLTADDADDLYPVASPDGKRIAFRSDRAGDPDIWVMNADGTGAVNLTAGSGRWESAPSWSPDGRRIVFERTSLPGDPAQDPAVEASDEIWTMSSRGGSERRLTRNATKDEGPSFSPDGRLIAFTTERRDPNGDVWVMSRTGLGARPVFATPATEESPEWQTLPRRKASSMLSSLVASLLR